MRQLLAVLSAAFLAAPAFASQPVDGAVGFQPAATRIAERVHEFHNVILVIITAITLFVLALLLVVIVRYNGAMNKVPRRFSHNTLVEVVWTVVPALILVGIASLSFPNLYYQDVPPNLGQISAESSRLLNAGKTAEYQAYTRNHFPDAAEKGFINVKVQGNQWNWTYSYADLKDANGDPLEFISNPVHKGLPTDEADYIAATGRNDFASQPRNLAVDYPMVVPVNRYVRYYTAATDVIHSFAMPAFGIKTDAIPGRLNEGWFLVDKPGVYYGQCSEICGVNHAFMPIEIRVVSEAQFERWAELMLAGDYEAAVASVRQIAGVAPETQLAATN